jgi:flagellar assembly protein FliH
MILKSESVKRVVSELPVDLGGGKPHVSLLEFLSVEMPRRPGSIGEGSHGGSGLGEPTPDSPPVSACVDAAATAARAASQEDLQAQERAIQTRVMVEAGRAEARAATRRELEGVFEDRIAAERQRIAIVCSEFMRDRARYFADAEEQVVKLALAIAARVLHRESMMDPLLLSGAVRVAIAKVEEGSAVSLRVRPGEAGMWREVFPPESEPAIEIVGDERMEQGEVVLETVIGRVELGVAVQLEEIEQGFFDLLQRRPN